MQAISALAIVLFVATTSAANAACPKGYYNCGGRICCPE
jgi:hypothetical protein